MNKQDRLTPRETATLITDMVFATYAGDKNLFDDEEFLTTAYGDWASVKQIQSIRERYEKYITRQARAVYMNIHYIVSQDMKWMS